MRKLLVFIVAAIAFAVCASAQEGVPCTLKFQGQMREYILYLPERAEGAPLVIVAHGYGGNPERLFGIFKKAAAEQGFALCCPRGLKDPEGDCCWNVGYSFQLDTDPRDDVGFLCYLAATLQQEHSLGKAFFTGHSNGGDMSILLAYTHPEVFTAVAPIAGVTMEWEIRRLKPERPVPMMMIHGTADNVSFWDGDPLDKGKWGAYQSVPMTVANWATFNGCTYETVEELPLYTPESNKVLLHRYEGGVPLRFYEVVGGSHGTPVGDFDVASEILSFFRSFAQNIR